MRLATAIRFDAVCRALSACALFTLGTAVAAEPAPFVQNGKAGFVVAHIEYALARDAKDTGACPNGMTQGYRNPGDILVGPKPESAAKEDAKDENYLRRVIGAALSNPNAKNLCLNPELGAPDPNFRTVTGPNVPVVGIDLDGQVSTVNGKPKPGTCAHDDFTGMDGERGVDNQFFRVVGCSNSFQSTGQSNTYEIEMHTGSWGILITLAGIDDIRNDDNVEVGFYANGDPIELSPTREPLENSTYAIQQDPRFQAKTRGRIKDGVLTTDPVDVRFHWVVNSIYLDRPLKSARVKMTLSKDGKLEGILAGYTPVEELYDFQYGFRNGKDAKGGPAPLQLRTVSSIGQAAVLGHTCNGAYYALYELADGARDPQTGKCTSISTQYRIKAIPAFVVDVKTKSTNEDLKAP